jgi:hypothetical protein
MLKTPGIKRLKLSYDEPPSSFAFKFNLRRYAKVVFASSSSIYGLNTKVPFSESDVTDTPASLYAVGRCRLTLSNPS